LQRRQWNLQRKYVSIQICVRLYNNNSFAYMTSYYESTLFRNGSKQPKLHPDVNSLIIEFQQTYLIPNGGEASCQTHDNTWILTKDQNTRLFITGNTLI